MTKSVDFETNLIKVISIVVDVGMFRVIGGVEGLVLATSVSAGVVSLCAVMVSWFGQDRISREEHENVDFRMNLAGDQSDFLFDYLLGGNVRRTANSPVGRRKIAISCFHRPV